ncbi:(Fe-S)-binding protein [Rhodocyclus tenuis]|uniref:Ion-translocating oxidoreductase complex subunit B n=1 Tax=Rhodocyclus tenuis TaxID=1066 RepID=A0A840FWA0_RHOTE|nr:(Fe-S)-binding protein [Rhodocyclus tenuis]MBB4246367.1 Na+-translocating ferredoxin:NAD+ oxidoreductase RNF subunit RnfB [Rhodocyclus tenuis]MBK1681916.1 Fe-S cluster protein [Rhodocyclus tenuis]
MESLSTLAIAGVFMAGLGVFLAAMLAAANRKLYVWEDPRIGEVEELLPKSNCGACGQAGCRDFAEKVVNGDVVPAQCTVSSPEQRAEIASTLGVDAGSIARKIARLACGGGRHVAFLRARYAGLETCRAATVVGGGGKECAWGCLGLGDCVSVCKFGALSLDSHGLPVVDPEKCTACNDCVEVCPKGLFSLELISSKLWVACKNQADGDTAEAACEVACTACGKCVADAAPELIRVDRNLAVIEPALIDKAERSVIDRCSTGAIVWFETPDRPVKGKSAHKVLRNEPLPLLES